MRHLRRLGLGTGVAALVVAAVAAGAWACIAGPTLEVSPTQATPGSEVALKGVSYNRNPIVVRFNGLNGPVIGTIQPTGGSATSSDWALNGTVTIPADAKPGNYVIVATQPSGDGKLTQVPTRGLVTVVSTGGAPLLGSGVAALQPEERPTGLVRTDNSVSAGALLLAGLGVAGLAMFVAGAAALLAGRRAERAEPEPSPVQLP